MAKMERPILFSGEMVKAILEGRKSQTRRVMNPQPTREFNAWDEKMEPGDCSFHRGLGIPVRISESSGKNKRAAGELTWTKIECPYGKPGDSLWVRETFMHEGADGRNEYLRNNGMTPKFIYRATDPRAEGLSTMFKWKPSIFMPRWASRIDLEITHVRVERIQDISGMDCIAEGVKESGNSSDGEWRARETFKELWDSINEKRGFGWEANPWVWAINFKVVKAGQ